jgi:CBS domain-containing protein
VRRIRDLMTADPVWIASSADLLEAVRLMREHDVGGLPVCDSAGRVVGMISDRTVLMAWPRSGVRRTRHLTAGSLVDGNPVTVSPDEYASWALELMSAHRVRRLPVVEGGRLVGILTQTDLARTMPVDDMGRLLFDLATTQSRETRGI